MRSAKYAKWVSDFLSTHTPQGTCQSATEKMQKAFPELRRVRGHIVCASWGERAHWWLETADGKIVDPTESQFPTIYCYEEYREGDIVKIGKCMNCGTTIMGLPVEAPKTMCSSECYTAFAFSLSL